MCGCPVATTVVLIGAKWELLIMRNLLSRPWRFNELKQNSERIIQKVLTDSLRSMEAVGIITRTVYPEVSPRVEYALSELGESMRPILNAMEVWGRSYKGKLTGQSTCSSHIPENAPGPFFGLRCIFMIQAK
mgnify:FL=1